ncbi:hypothetical protein GB931_02915 [Modestobacter sp. I12A-02628]|uniref:VOC domain-containing protein n=1 Tax=Goekera deserti TaxID=2497753 RepID=A0A7K3WDC9_9ACTN|nr:VOC family protein [Goekera deserti]MPQ96889.1 hypothetical protein [Goekera deserti]NDI46798.1 hypothetical protein [Goekera deserti]NEL54367.1 hypothetical protein [Goekera deserti]
MSIARPALAAVPCLLVADVAQAARYYRDTLGFSEIEFLEDPPVALYVRRGSATLLLQATDRADASVAEVSPRRLAVHAWDALLLVDDVEALAADLKARGARITVGLGITPVSDHTLEVRDPWGNLLAFAGAPVGLLSHATDRARRLLPPPVMRRVRELRAAREERAPAQAVRDFCAALDGQKPFYMFFTKGLLHWVRQAAAQVPPDVTLALIGSDLPPDELEWLRQRLDRPVHNIALGVDDNTTWEFLFDAHQSDFGWLDIDCFVLNPALFAEMTRFEPGVAVNGMWTYDAVPGAPIACTHFAFINAEVLRDLRTQGDALSPTNYDWTGATISLLHPRTQCRVPTKRQRELLLRVLPEDPSGRPRPPGGSTFFDTLVAYQVGAYARGFRTEAVRPLAHRTQAGLSSAAQDSPVWQQDMSDEVVHVGAVSYYRRDFHSSPLRAMYLAAEYALIAAADGDLPDSYVKRADQLSAELSEHGLSADEGVTMLRDHLVHDRGLAEVTADRVLGRNS